MAKLFLLCSVLETSSGYIVLLKRNLTFG